jgi:5-methylthioadenosine/S-adenosylhomocysteine deaminase
VRILRARWVLPITAAPIADGAVAVEDGRIAYVGARRGAPRGEVTDLGDAVILPGLVNAHTHLELTAMRGFLEELDFRDWINTLQRAKVAVLDRERMLDAARHGIVEGLRAGITTYADTCDSGVALEAMRELGVRGVMYQEVFGPAPEQCAEALAGLRAKVEELRAHEDALRRVGVSPHAPYTVSDALLAAVADYARRERLPVAIHIAESEVEHSLVVRGEGVFADGLRSRGIHIAPRARSPIALLDALGVLAGRPLLIHCVRADAEDIAAISAASCSVAHCPVSNAKLGHGVAPLLEMLSAGIPVALGSDSMASNNRMDLLEEGRVAALAQRARAGAPSALSGAEVLALATMGGARALGLAERMGSLERGKEADIAAFPLDTPGALPLYDPAAALVFALGGVAARLVMVAGEVRVEEGRVLGADPALPARIADTAARLAAWRAEATARPPR